MRRLLPALALVLIAATLGSLGATSPSWAHSEHDTPLASAALNSHADLAPDRLAPPALSVAPDPTALPWPLLVVALFGVLLCRRRARHAVALALVLLLAVLAFEDGLHSVHHLTEHAKPVRCAIAAATAHLSATAVDITVSADVVLPVVAVSVEPGQTDPVARFLCPDQGRSPPSQTA